MEFYTYLHRRNDTNEIFYIGKGKKGRAWAKQERNRYWHHVVDKHGFTVEIVCYWQHEKDAYEHERFLVACFRDLNAPLVNMSDGGDAPPRSRHWLGKKRSQETVEKIRNKLKGRKRDPNAVEKTVSKLRGRKLSDEIRLKGSLAKTGSKNPMFGKYKYTLEDLEWIYNHTNAEVTEKYNIRDGGTIRDRRKQYLKRIGEQQ